MALAYTQPQRKLGYSIKQLHKLTKPKLQTQLELNISRLRQQDKEQCWYDNAHYLLGYN